MDIQFTPGSLLIFISSYLCMYANCAVFNDPYSHVLTDKTKQLLRLTENIELLINDLEETACL